MDLHAALWNILGLGMLPAWLLAGGADWLCHRRSRIETTSGPRESLLHIVLHLQIAVPVLLGLWLRINAALLVVMALGVAAHMLTSWWDTSFAQPKRHIAPVEQQVHSWLEMVPLFSLVLVCLLHVDELRTPTWSFEHRHDAIPGAWPVVLPVALAAGLALIGEELLRGLRASRVRP